LQRRRVRRKEYLSRGERRELRIAEKRSEERRRAEQRA
jgi:hypothetical protein